MAGIFKNTGGIPEEELFAQSNLEALRKDLGWDLESSPLESSEVQINTSLGIGSEDEPNVSVFGPEPGDVGAYQTAWESARSAEASAKIAKDAAEKTKDVQNLATSVKASEHNVVQKEAIITSNFKIFSAQYLDIKRNMLPSITRSALNAETSERNADLAQKAAELANTVSQQKLNEVQNVGRDILASEKIVQSYTNQVKLLKAQLEASTNSFISNFLNYRGMWDPTSNKYPDTLGGDSVWDINLPTGFSTYTFDGKAWSEGDRLFWYGENSAAKQWVHLKSGSGYVVTNLDKLYQSRNSKNKPGGYAGLDVDGKVLPSQMPALSILDVEVDKNKYQRNAQTTFQKGDVSIISPKSGWKSNTSYSKGEIVYTISAASGDKYKQKYYVSKKDFVSGSSFNQNNWTGSNFITNHEYIIGDEIVYNNKIYIVIKPHTSGTTVSGDNYLLDTVREAGVSILAKNPSGKGGTTVDSDWVQVGTDFHVQSFNGRMGIILPQTGDYKASQIEATPYSSVQATNVQDFLNTLSDIKIDKGEVDNKAEAALKYLAIDGKAKDSDKLDNLDSKEFLKGVANESRRIFVGGDANSYYPTLFTGTVSYAWNTINISRASNWKAPDEWSTGVQKGGLTFCVEYSGDTLTGNNDKNIRVTEFNETITNMVGGLRLTEGGIVVWLRGGGAQYDIRGPRGTSQYYQVILGTYSAPGGTKYPVRSYDANIVAQEVTNKQSLRDSGQVFDTGNRVWSNSNKPSAADLGVLPGGWSPDFDSVTGKPDTATRWPKWSEVTETPTLFSGSYLDLTNIPKSFTPKTHRHSWGEIDSKPAQAIRWPTWGEVTGKPSDVLTQTVADTLYFKNSAVSTSLAMKVFKTNFTNVADYQNSPISIRERGGNSGSENLKFAPNINYHWSGKHSKSLLMGADGVLYWGSYSSVGDVTADEVQITDKYFYTSGNVNLTRQSQQTIVQRNGTQNATITIDPKYFKIGDRVVIYNVLENSGVVTITMSSGNIYVPNGTFDSSHTFTGMGTVTLIKHEALNFLIASIT